MSIKMEGSMMFDSEIETYKLYKWNIAEKNGNRFSVFVFKLSS